MMLAKAATGGGFLPAALRGTAEKRAWQAWPNVALWYRGCRTHRSTL